MDLNVASKIYATEIDRIEGAKISVNTRHALQIILLLYDISFPSSLSFRARSNSLVASTSWYLVVFS